MKARSWPERLTIGDHVRFDGGTYTINELRGQQLTLVNAANESCSVDALTVLFHPDFAALSPASAHGSSPGPPPEGGDALAMARWWEPHIVEVLSGVPLRAAAGTTPRPEFDPRHHSLDERERAKAEELSRMGVPGASARTVRRKRQRYQAQGVAGLVDRRAGRRETPGARLHPRIVETVRDIVESHTGGRLSSERVRAEVLRRLADPIFRGEISSPSRSAIHRLRSDLADGPGRRRINRNITRGLGERVHLDVVRLPLRGNGDKREPEPVQVLFAMDEATRLLLAAVVHGGTWQTPIGAALLARMCVPHDLRADWLTMHPSGHGPAGGAGPTASEGSPPVRPVTLVVHDGLGLGTLRGACVRLGIHVQYARQAPAVRHPIERSMAQAASLFTDYLLSPAGQDAHAAGWSQETVQELLDSWVTRVWPNSEVPLSPRSEGAVRTPLERYATAVSDAGWIPAPLPPNEFLELLPASTRRIGRSGLRLGGRTYDSPALDPLRGEKVSPTSAGRQFPVRWDPYDLRHVWVHAPGDRWLRAPVVRESLNISSNSSRPTPTKQPPPPDALRPSSGLARLADGSERLTHHAQLRLRSPDVTAAVRRVEEVLILNQAAEGTSYGVLVSGPPGSGKTTALAEVAWRCTGQSLLSSAAGATAAVHVLAPPATSPRLLLAELVRCSLGTPLRGSPTTADLADRASHALERARTRMVVIDEAHHLCGPGGRSREAMAEVLDYLSLCDSVPVTFVYAGLEASGQLTSSITRIPHRRLLPVTLTDLPESEAWTDLLHQAEQNLRLQRRGQGARSPGRRHVRQAVRRQVPQGRQKTSTTKVSCWRSTTSPPSTGSTCAPQIRSSRPSPPSACGPRSPKAPASAPQPWPWSSSSSSPPRPAGEP